MDFATFVAAMAQPPPSEYRYGQHVYNSLYVVRPDLAERVQCTALDPYYDDGAVPELMDWLSANWHDLGAVTPGG